MINGTKSLNLMVKLNELNTEILGSSKLGSLTKIKITKKYENSLKNNFIQFFNC